MTAQGAAIAAALAVAAGLGCSKTCPVAPCPSQSHFDTDSCKCRSSDAGLGVEDAAAPDAPTQDGALHDAASSG